MCPPPVCGNQPVYKWVCPPYCPLSTILSTILSTTTLYCRPVCLPSPVHCTLANNQFLSSPHTGTPLHTETPPHLFTALMSHLDGNQHSALNAPSNYCSKCFIGPLIRRHEALGRIPSCPWSRFKGDSIVIIIIIIIIIINIINIIIIILTILSILTKLVTPTLPSSPSSLSSPSLAY